MLGLSLRSLRAKLLLFSLVLIVVPGVIVAVIALTGARRALRDAIGRQLAEVAHDTASELTGTAGATADEPGDVGAPGCDA